MVLGILNAGRFASRRWPRFVVQGLHRNLSLLALAFLAVHVATTVVDEYVSDRPARGVRPVPICLPPVLGWARRNRRAT